MKDFLTTLYNSLNSIEVKGKDNLDTLLGCLMAIEQQIAKITAEESAETEENDG